MKIGIWVDNYGLCKSLSKIKSYLYTRINLNKSADNTSVISSSLATGGAGYRFENCVQASFVVLMLTNGCIPLLPNCTINKIKLQGRIDGCETDDVIVFTKDSNNQEKKFLGNIKLSIQFTKSNAQLASVIQSAWQDFSNADVFNKNIDKLILITGPLNAIDTNAVLWILEQAKCTENANDFLKRVETVNFSPVKSNEKLKVIQHHLTNANSNVSISNDNLYEFLNNWQLLIYDLGEQSSVVLSLLHSHMAQYSTENAELIWGKITGLVADNNQHAGTITKTGLPQELKALFDKITYTIPDHLSATLQNTLTCNFYGYENNFAIANLIGSWNEQNEGDIAILKNIFGNNYHAWIENAREILNKSDNNIITLKNGVWKTTQTKELYNALSGYIFDDWLDKFKEIVLRVLKEENPAFELPKDQRYAANIYGKNLTHSNHLREGIAKSLAILGNTQNPTNCDISKQDTITTLSIREIFSNANWQLWGSLNDVMPILAEASPNEFLSQIEQDLNNQDPEIPKLFSQEGEAIMGQSYLTGLLWGLEVLAWDKDLLVRVCVILTKLANIDPGGQWNNRPINSLKAILLPWLPQTIASADKRKVVIDTICDEYPNMGWDVLISLLPNHMASTSESCKPKWRDTIPHDWEKGVTRQEYWQQIDYYAQKLISLAENKINKLTVLIDNLSNLPELSFNNLLQILSSDSILNLPEDSRLMLWQQLIKFISRHKLYPDSDWSLNNELIKKIVTVADKLKPSDPGKLHQHLFSHDYDYPYKKDESYEERDEKIVNIRKDAIEQILTAKGVESVIEFARVVKVPKMVGNSLALIKTNEIDNFLFPNFLNDNNNKISEFISGYIWSSFDKDNWRWVDDLNKDNWKIEEQYQFLTYLPFCKKTWNKVANWLENQEDLYWKNINITPYDETKNLSYAIKKLLKYKRPKASIKCLRFMIHSEEDIDIELCIKALTGAISSQEPNYAADYYDITKLIKTLQADNKIPLQDIMAIEWSYLSLLDDHHKPIILESQLANNPEFFCEIIQLIYRPKNCSKDKRELTEEEQNIARNAFKLLHNWKTVPGTDRDGIFNKNNFNIWLARIKEICTKSNHLEVALSTIGAVLIYSPEDPDGLWINKTVATALNEENVSKMRDGYSTGIFNSRGVHSVDPTGKSEFKLSDKYNKQANKVENAGFHRLAHTLRKLSDNYQRQANHIIDKYKKSDLDSLE